MVKNLYAVLDKCSRSDFDKRKASRLIFLIKHTDDEKKIQSLKFELFKKSSKLLIKAINNFFKLTVNFPKEKIIHTNSDIALECWFIFDRCVQNIKVEEHKKYNFYLNTALNRGIYRVFERNYKKHYDVISSSDANEISIMTKKINSHVDLTDIDLSLNFNDIEIEIINFKVSGEKLNVFLKKMKISNIQYNEYLNVIKDKMIELYKTEEDDNY